MAPSAVDTAAGKLTSRPPPSQLQSPLASYTGSAIASRVGLAPILRAGLGMEAALLELFPEAPVYHLGLYRCARARS